MSRMHLIGTSLGSLVLVLLLLLGQAHAQESPAALIEQVSKEVMETATNDQAVQAGDTRRITELVETKILPHVNLERMTSKTIGPLWNQATPEQRLQLQREFKTLLIRTFAGTLAQTRNQAIKVRPVRDASDPTNVLVKSEVSGGNGPIQLDYRLEKSGSTWKIWDVNILGLWIISTYQGQFKPVLSQGGIEAVIQRLTDLNSSASRSKP